MSDNEQKKPTVAQRLGQGAINVVLWPVIAVMTLMWRRKK